MQIARLTGPGADQKVYVTFKNVDGSGSVTVNDAVCFVVDGNSVDGVNAAKPAAANIKNWAGIADETVPINGIGRAQVFGYRDSIRISNEGTSITITAGDALIPVAGQPGMGSVGGVTLAYTNMLYAIAATTATISADGYVKGQIRAI